MRKVKVDLDELMDAFDDCRIGYQYYLDLETGELLHILDEWMTTDEIERISERLNSEPERYLAIPTEGSHKGYQDMVAFTEGVENMDLKEKLLIALDGRGAFRRFKNVLSEYPEERQKWFKFKENRLKQRVIEWLEENEIELI